MAKLTLKMIGSAAVIGVFFGGIIGFILLFVSGFIVGMMGWDYDMGPGMAYGICFSSMIVIFVLVLLSVLLFKKEDDGKVDVEPVEAHRCRMCGQPMRFVKSFSSWYCDTCQKYE